MSQIQKILGKYKTYLQELTAFIKSNRLIRSYTSDFNSYTYCKKNYRRLIESVQVISIIIQIIKRANSVREM